MYLTLLKGTIYIPKGGQAFYFTTKMMGIGEIWETICSFITSSVPGLLEMGGSSFLSDGLSKFTCTSFPSTEAYISFWVANGEIGFYVGGYLFEAKCVIDQDTNEINCQIDENFISGFLRGLEYTWVQTKAWAQRAGNAVYVGGKELSKQSIKGLNIVGDAVNDSLDDLVEKMPDIPDVPKIPDIPKPNVPKPDIPDVPDFGGFGRLLAETL